MINFFKKLFGLNVSQTAEKPTNVSAIKSSEEERKTVPKMQSAPKKAKQKPKVKPKTSSKVFETTAPKNTKKAAANSSKTVIAKERFETKINNYLELEPMEESETRVFDQFPDLRGWNEQLHGHESDKAERSSNHILKKYPDFYFVYFALANYYHMKGDTGKRDAVLLEGLNKCKSINLLYAFIGEIQFEEENYVEAFNWMVKSCKLQVEYGNYVDHNPYLYLATLAYSLSMIKEEKQLFGYVDSYQQVRFNPAMSDKLWRVAQTNRNVFESQVKSLCKHIPEKRPPRKV